MESYFLHSTQTVLQKLIMTVCAQQVHIVGAAVSGQVVFLHTHTHSVSSFITKYTRTNADIMCLIECPSGTVCDYIMICVSVCVVGCVHIWAQMFAIGLEYYVNTPPYNLNMGKQHQR